MTTCMTSPSTAREVLPLKARDAHDGVIYLGSFSEILCPGIRLSWIVAPAAVIDRLLLIKQFTDLYSNRILQGALLEFCQKGLLDRHLKRKQSVYRKRRDLMLEAMKAHFPSRGAVEETAGRAVPVGGPAPGHDALSPSC